MFKYKIEKGKPLPKWNNAKLPLQALAIGDSFFIPDRDSTISSLRSACNHFVTKNKEKRFTVRLEPGGYRVWRIKKK